MIAPRGLPTDYVAWNAHWGAPFGRPVFVSRFFNKDGAVMTRRRGPFAFQSNNTTREFEYPWVYHQINRRGGRQTVIDLGGSLAGLQFVLASEGHEVTNVDPGMAAGGLGWNIDAELHRKLCSYLRAPVKIISKGIQDAGLADNSADVVYSVSSLEHFDKVDSDHAVVHIPRVLKPGGVLILTVDLFLDVEPFCDETQNQWGGNVNVRDWLERAGLELVDAKREELYPEFSTKRVLRNLQHYHVGRNYPCLAQCVVARKPS